MSEQIIPKSRGGRVGNGKPYVEGTQSQPQYFCRRCRLFFDDIAAFRDFFAKGSVCNACYVQDETP